MYCLDSHYKQGGRTTCKCLCFHLQLDKVNNRVKALKRQLDETEEEVARLNSQKRKLQRDIDEQMEQNEVASREISQLRKFRYVAFPVSSAIDA